MSSVVAPADAYEVQVTVTRVTDIDRDIRETDRQPKSGTVIDNQVALLFE